VLGHLGINVPDLAAAKEYFRRRSLVDRIHGHVLSVGGSIIHAPQHFPQYPGHYYATFWSDPFGIKRETVCHHDRD